MERKSKILWALLAALLAGDAITTWVAIGRAGIAVEANPLIQGLVSKCGKLSLVFSRSAVVGAGALLWKLSEGERKYLIPLGSSVIMGTVVALNTLSLFYM